MSSHKINLSVKQIAEQIHEEQRIVKISKHGREGERKEEEARMRRPNAL